MREVDARGLSCPEPIMITDEAVKSGDMPVKVLVSEHHQMINVEKYAASKGKAYKSEEVEDGYVITIE
ncbi:MAG: sulfurtransferase TusA family protein [Eubacteriales bacterium]|nr:sulfurtransferase TusA family protein [Eubacteriales bacterium]MDY3332624.1 sulfurtransferase TusA family protein [Gallibacter sp.]